MDDIKKISLTIEFWECSDKTKQEVLKSVMEDIIWVAKENLIWHTSNYITWEEIMAYKIDYSTNK